MDKKSLRVLVCVKAIESFPSQTSLSALSNTAHLESIFKKIQPNPDDLYALETALELKSRDGAEVITVTLGADEDIGAVQYCLAAGADCGILLQTTDKTWLDAWNTANLLAQHLPSDINLILCGERSLDGGSGLVGFLLAEKMNLPLITQVTNLEVDISQKCLFIERLLNRGKREIVQSLFPCVLTISEFSKSPRFISTHRLQEAEKSLEKIQRKRIEESLFPNRIQIEKVESPRPRPRKMRRPDTNMSAAQRLQFMLSAAQASQTTGLTEGTPEEITEKIFAFLLEQGLFPQQE